MTHLLERLSGSSRAMSMKRGCSETTHEATYCGVEVQVSILVFLFLQAFYCLIFELLSGIGEKLHCVGTSLEIFVTTNLVILIGHQLFETLKKMLTALLAARSPIFTSIFETSPRQTRTMLYAACYTSFCA